MNVSQASEYSPTSSTQKKRTLGRSKVADTQVMTYRRKTPTSMSIMAMSIRTTTATRGTHGNARRRSVTRGS